MEQYIGITDFTDFRQVKKMLEVFDAHKPETLNLRLHVGVMMSYKTLHNVGSSKYQNIFPPKEKIADIFASDRVYNCLHYANYDDDLSDHLEEDLLNVIPYCGKLHAIQLDMVWPDPKQIERVIREAFHYSLKIILQIGKGALDELNNDPQAVVDKLLGYRGIVDAVLIDRSMGKGLGMDAQFLLPFVRAIKQSLPFNVVVAGGLGPGKLDLAEPLIAEFPDLSIDAQGQLRSSGSNLHPIDWDMAEAYIKESLELFSKYNK